MNKLMIFSVVLALSEVAFSGEQYVLKTSTTVEVVDNGQTVGTKVLKAGTIVRVVEPDLKKAMDFLGKAKDAKKPYKDAASVKISKAEAIGLYCSKSEGIAVSFSKEENYAIEFFGFITEDYLESELLSVTKKAEFISTFDIKKSYPYLGNYREGFFLH